MAKIDIPQQVTFADTTPEYEAFVEKFKPKKTTDDCYTPANIYEAVLSWVCKTYGVDRDKVVRPFWPGGDYERFEYHEDSVVVDNPPFSIVSNIADFYNRYGVKYFLFAPHLTNIGICRGLGCCHIIVGAPITYENGATVSTSFVTNLDDRIIFADPDLFKAVDEANKENTKSDRTVPKYEFPDNIITSAKVGWIVHKGIRYELKRDDGVFIRQLDSQQASGKAIFGGGILISDRAAAEKAAAEKAAAEKAAAEKAAATRWPLSLREQQIIEELNKHGKR